MKTLNLFKTILSMLLITALLLTGCSSAPSDEGGQQPTLTPSGNTGKGSGAGNGGEDNGTGEAGTGTHTGTTELLGIKAAQNYKDLYKALYTVQYANKMATSRYYNWYDGLSKDMVIEEAAVDVPTTNMAPSVAETNDFSETNIQVAGVDEGDIVKTDGRYIYILDVDRNTFMILEANGAALQTAAAMTAEDIFPEVNRIDQDNSWDSSSSTGEQTDSYSPDEYLANYSISINEFYICGDKAVFLSNDYANGAGETIISIIDISDRTAPRYAASRKQDGYYHNSRRVGDILYTFSSYYASSSVSDIKPSETEEFIPSADSALIDYGNIFIPDYYSDNCYTVITALNLNTPDSFISSNAILANPSQCYVSTESIYFCCYNWYSNGKDTNETQIIKLSYTDGQVSAAGSAFIKGSLLNQFSLDEKDGFLRVVATVNEYSYEHYDSYKEGPDFGDAVENVIGTIVDAFIKQSEKTKQKYDIYLDDEYLASFDMNYMWPYTSRTFNSLYILDSSMKQISQVEYLAENERIYSARFIGNTGYFVTFRQTDPLFSVDLADPYNPKVLGALKIPGFSSYLHPYSETLLLGIGNDADEQTGATGDLKLSMFDISDPTNVKEVHKVVIDGYNYSSALYNHKSVLVNSDKNIIGFDADGYSYEYDPQTQEYNDYTSYGYMCFSYDEQNGFMQMLDDRHIINWSDDNQSNYERDLQYYGTSRRGLYINDTFYLIYLGYMVKTYDINTWTPTNDEIFLY